MPLYILETPAMLTEGQTWNILRHAAPAGLGTLPAEALKLHIIGRRWFQKSYGNTYHTAQIIIDGKTVHRTPQAYGYGDHYLQSAVDWLKQSGHLPADGEHISNTRFLHEESGFDFTYECHDVQRQKDMR